MNGNSLLVRAPRRIEFTVALYYTLAAHRICVLNLWLHLRAKEHYLVPLEEYDLCLKTWLNANVEG